MLGESVLYGRQHRLWMSRRAALCGFATLLSTSAVSAAAEASFSFGLTSVFLDNDIGLLALLQQYLAPRLQRPVKLVKRRTYQELLTMLLSGELDAAWIGDFPYVQHHDSLALVVVPLYRHQPLYESYVIVNEVTEATAFDDLRRTVHAFCYDGTSSHLITRWLLASRRATVEEFFRNFFFTYSYRNIVRAVGAGLAESGSIEGFVWDLMKERQRELVDKTRIIYRSERLGFPPIVALETSSGLPATQAFATALLDMTSEPLGREILSMLALDGFTTVSPDLYEATAEKWRAIKAQV
jgi:phosphonate transport system substrate-binding protein